MSADKLLLRSSDEMAKLLDSGGEARGLSLAMTVVEDQGSLLNLFAYQALA